VVHHPLETAFMCFGAKAPAPPPPPAAAPKRVSEATLSARDSERKRQAAAAGRAATNLTGGLLTPIATDKKKVLGG
jgi:hypothetical protein